MMKGGDVAEEEAIAFIRDVLGSVYSVELLLLIRRHGSRTWRGGDLVRELRSSATAVGEALNRLIRAGLVTERPAGRYGFAPSSLQHAQLAAAVEKLYRDAPISVMKAIVTAPAGRPRGSET
jgi:DNA-binding IclR family transcriptional regulator